MKNKAFLLTLIIAIVASIGITQIMLSVTTNLAKNPQTESVNTHSVGQTIAADGTIHSENEATLHFQTGGTVVYLPFKVGDSVQLGQTIASLDQRAIEDNLKSALAGANSQQLSFDTTNDKNGDRSLTDTGLSTSAFRELQTAANTLTQAQLAVDIQKIAQQQASLTAPFNGIITAEDITSPNVNVTPLTSFSIADPTTPVFRANVASEDIDFVQVGSPATLMINGGNQQITGTVERIYPTQTTINGQNVYQVDITSPSLKGIAKLGQNGVATIRSTVNSQTVLVPTWTILGHNYLWVMEKNRPLLKKVSVGKTHGENTEIVGGLMPNDKVIISPKSIAAERYAL